MGKILVAEDDKFQQMAISAVLKGAGHECVLADDGNQAVSKFKSDGPFNLVLLDIKMPNKDGLQAAAEILAAGCSCKIVGLSADDDDDTLENCIDIGMYSLLSKPIKIDAVSKLL